ncbi:MAG: hypothetical protein HRU34_16595 [Richelia sp.]|nr:hypothetical protein [Richelia sp.]CDN11485.1 hypothetical protein RintRC_5081 [Richelia intracellularis]
MFITELTPIFKEFAQNPVSFMGGFVSGVLKLKLTDDPVHSWLAQQTGTASNVPSGNEEHNGKASGPQSISID